MGVGGNVPIETLITRWLVFNVSMTLMLQVVLCPDRSFGRGQAVEFLCKRCDNGSRVWGFIYILVFMRGFHESFFEKNSNWFLCDFYAWLNNAGECF